MAEGFPDAAVAALPPAFLGFFDDAAVFPPGLAPLEVAIADHVERRETVLAATVGPLVLPLKDLDRASELAAALDLSMGPVLVSAVTTAGQLADVLERIAHPAPGLCIVAVELKTSPQAQLWEQELAAAATAARAGTTVYLELSPVQIDAGALGRIAGSGVRLKFRTGGIEAGLFPTAGELATVLTAAVERGIPFKLTAGLHRGVRYTDMATGFTHHGFLNIAVAAALAMQGASVPQLEEVLLETNQQSLTRRFRNLAAEEGIPAWRRSFVSFGTCSVTEPAESLQHLGLLPANTARRVTVEEEHTP